MLPPCSGGESCGQKWPGEDYYDITKRAPQFARADRACWWELSSLSAHVHPSVGAMAGALLAGTSVVYDGDPLGDLTVLAFLDKFVKRYAPSAAHSVSQAAHQSEPRMSRSSSVHRSSTLTA